MNHRTTIMKSVFRWANKQIAAGCACKDGAAVKKAVVLAAICTSDPEEKAHLKNILVTHNLADCMSLRHASNLRQDVPFFVIYGKLTDQLPAALHTRLSELQQTLKKQLESGQAWQSLGAFLLLAQLFPAELYNTPSDRLTNDTDKSLSHYLFADDNELNKLIYSIHIYSSFGTRECSNAYARLMPALEVRMIAALKNYNLLQACALLQAINYLDVAESGAAQDTLEFLMNNQSREGFIGYYEREFLKMNLTTSDSKRHFLLSSTLASVIAIMEHSTTYRFYKNVLRV